MLDLIIITLLVVFNAQLARKKNQNPALWGFLTVIGCLVVGGFLSFIYLALTYKGDFTQAALVDYMLRLQQDQLKVMLLLMFEIGGGLLIRFILEKTPPNGPPPQNRS